MGTRIARACLSLLVAPILGATLVAPGSDAAPSSSRSAAPTMAQQLHSVPRLAGVRKKHHRAPRPPASDHVKPVAATSTYTTTDAMVPVMTGPQRTIAIDIDTRLYVPSNASAAHPQPAILMTHGFGLSKDSNEVVDTARFFASHGYVVLTFTSSGFGKSGGCVTLQSEDYDVPTASQLITKLLDPRPDVLHDSHGAVVGTIGGSYGGGEQLGLAAADPRIHTSIVGRSWNDLVYSLDPNNRVAPGDPTGFTHALDTQGVFKQEWTSLFFALGDAQPAMGNGGCAAAKEASGDPAEIASIGSCPGYYAPLCTTYEQLTSTGDISAAGKRLIARASGSTFLAHVHVPVLLVQGQSDTLFNENDASATYLALQRRHVPVGMIWNSGGHGGYDSQPGECEMYDGVERSVHTMDDCYLTLRSLGWMNHWLRHTRAGRGPAFTYYRDWVAYAGHGADDEQYGVSSTYPVGHTRLLTLSGTGSLVANPAQAVAATDTLTNPGGGEPAAYTETSNFTGPDSSPSASGMKPTDIPGQFAAFRTAPYPKPGTLVGVPTAHVLITNSNGQDMVFFAKLEDVAPDGTATLIHRLIAPVRVPAGAVGKPVTFKLLGVAHHFAKGHRLELMLCTTDQTSYNDKVADLLTVHSGRGNWLSLPTVRR